jgi:hypothetical protein
VESWRLRVQGYRLAFAGWSLQVQGWRVRVESCRLRVLGWGLGDENLRWALVRWSFHWIGSRGGDRKVEICCCNIQSKMYNLCLMSTTSHDIVAKLWNLCNILKDGGITYHQYVIELTYLLFLKIVIFLLLPSLHRRQWGS